MSQKHSLSWGPAQFTGEQSTPYRLEALSKGTNLGNPDPLVEVIRSLLTDGSLSTLQGWDNREAPLRLRISAEQGDAGPALAACERMLMGLVLAEEKPRLRWLPPATGALPSYFDVVGAKLERDHDAASGWDVEEDLLEYRYYVLTLTCLPFAAPELPVTVPALPIPPAVETSAVIDNASSLTGWSAESAGFGEVERRNLVVDPKPVDSDGWIGSTGTPMGPGAFKWHEAGTTGNPVRGTPWITGIVPGQSYTASVDLDFVRVFGFPLGSKVRLEIRWYNSANQVIRDSVGTERLESELPQRLTRTDEAPAGASRARIILTGYDMYGGLGQAKPAVLQSSHLLFETGDTAVYFDGDTPDGGTGYQWDGITNDSISTAYTPPAASLAPPAVGEPDAINLVSTTLPSASARTLTLVRDGAVAMSTSPYLRVTALISSTSTSRFYVRSAGEAEAPEIDPVAVVASSDFLGREYYFETGDFDQLKIEASKPAGDDWSGAGVIVMQVERTDTIRGTSTNRQRTRTATVIGSAPTQAAMRLYDATPGPLGADIMLYTSSNQEWSPPLRAEWLVSSELPVPDAATVSGSTNDLTTPMVFRMPAASFTSGTYGLLGRIDCTVAGTLTWSARTVDADGNATIGSSIVVSGSAAIPVTTGFDVLTIAALALPVIQVEGDQMVELTVSGTANMTVDELWLFGLTDGSLTWVHGLDTVTWVEVRSPGLGAARPSVYAGTGAAGEGGICVDSWCESFGAHRFDPGSMQVFTVASTSLSSQSELEFFPRYHSHVDDESTGTTMAAVA